MTSLVGAIGTMMLRELVTLRKQIEAYPSDESLWKVVPGISNSGGPWRSTWPATSSTSSGRSWGPAGMSGTGMPNFRSGDFPGPKWST